VLAPAGNKSGPSSDRVSNELIRIIKSDGPCAGKMLGQYFSAGRHRTRGAGRADEDRARALVQGHQGGGAVQPE